MKNSPVEGPRAEQGQVASEGRPSGAGDAAAPARELTAWSGPTPLAAVAGGLLAAAFAWSYWPTLVDLVATWNREADYSHGFLVVPFAVYLLWSRWDRFPGRAAGLAWAGLAVIVLSMGLRFFGALFFLGAVDGWSMLVWIAGAVWFLGGRRVMWWSLPVVGFLWFMVPLPWRAERMLSVPLQSIATRISSWALQTLGQPALPEGHTILLGDFHLEVEQACSGLRVFMGILALACAYLMVVPQRWWARVLLLVSVVPVALTANAARIVTTGLLYQYVSGEAARKFSHDIAGWAMILFAAGLFALVLWYVNSIVREVEVPDIGDVLRQERADATR